MQSFNDLALPEELRAALEKINFVKTTKIQSKAIPVLMEGQDLMACAETGSGKTGAYAIPMIAKILESDGSCGLILAPTRELAQQIAQFIKELTVKVPKFQTTLLVGGLDIRKQFKALQKKPNVIVATPGRLNDHLVRNTVQLNKVAYLVLDEGDRMLDMGFAPQLDRILKYVPKERQTSLFTATLEDKVVTLAKKYLNKPKKIVIGQTSQPVELIKQSVIEVEFKQKDDRILDELNARQGSIIVFVRTKHRTDRLTKILKDYGYSVDLIHGGRNQSQRNRAISAFKQGKVRILCATDVAARGLDVPQVEHVINFDLPDMDEDYVHRIGRTARNGAEGEAVSFVTPEEHQTWNILARKYHIKGVELKGTSRKGTSKKEGRGKRKSSDRSFEGKRGKKSYSKKTSADSPSKRSNKFSSGKKSSARSFPDEAPFEKYASKKKKRSFSRDYSEDMFGDDKFEKRSFSKKRSSGDTFESDRPKRSFSKKKSSGSSFSSEERSSKKKRSSDKYSYEDRPKRSSSKKSGGESGGKKRVSFKKKSGKTFKKSGGFKKSRAKQMSSRSSRG